MLTIGRPAAVARYSIDLGNHAGHAKTSVSAWTDPKMNHSDGPPQVAPLAFAGLGVLGVLASLKRFNS
jgi:hypothetical protein